MTDPRLLAAWRGVSAAFGSLGRVFIALDGSLRIRHVSACLDDIAGPGSCSRFAGRPVSDLLGEELFGEAGTLRRALLAGERREGWRVSVRSEPHGSRVASVTVAPLVHDGACDPHVRYLIVLRPLETGVGSEDGLTSFEGLIGRSPSMRRIFQLVTDLEHSEAAVLLTGESGTGKELVARAIHAHSARRDGPFVAVNCAAVPGELLESELFGHARGAFTSAVRDRVGRIELAARGTLFLDEIGDLPAPLQVKLLRVLQERTFERVGENHSRRMLARVVAATNVLLPRAIAEGRFREDLYYRLRVVPIALPPLRERREDLEPLAHHLLHRAATRNGRVLRLSPDTLRAILVRSWPGNVRELENALEYAVAVCRGPVVLPEDLPAEVPPAFLPDRLAASSAPAAPLNADAQAERQLIERALTQHHWCREPAARALGMSRTTLWRKMRELGLQR